MPSIYQAWMPHISAYTRCPCIYWQTRRHCCRLSPTKCCKRGVLEYSSSMYERPCSVNPGRTWFNPRAAFNSGIYVFTTRGWDESCDYELSWWAQKLTLDAGNPLCPPPLIVRRVNKVKIRKAGCCMCCYTQWELCFWFISKLHPVIWVERIFL
jgi:hypothetical protein